MGNYSIRELETLSGIKAHTIRMWEKRHGLISPKRTPTNIRYYSDDDLRKIINVSVLNNLGIKISKIAVMSDQQLSAEVVQRTAKQQDAAVFIDQFIVCMVNMEEEQFEKLLSHLIIKFGFEKTVTDVVYPFLEKIGILWQTGNITPAQEHFISNLIRQKVIVAIDSLPFPKHGSENIVLFLPEGEMHEIGLLFYHFLVKKMGYKTYYLGQHLPYADLKQVCTAYKPRYIITSVSVSQEPLRTKAYFDTLVKDFPGSTLLATGRSAKPYVSGAPNFKFVENIKALKSLLQG
ncbi:MAG: MerR family transcriptional regulator [Cytophagales bacterium]|nr:MerR family transcriptional regulator [Cytophagales bacterium]